jgi:hypothetical protein
MGATRWLAIRYHPWRVSNIPTGARRVTDLPPLLRTRVLPIVNTHPLRANLTDIMCKSTAAWRLKTRSFAEKWRRPWVYGADYDIRRHKQKDEPSLGCGDLGIG